MDFPGKTHETHVKGVDTGHTIDYIVYMANVTCVEYRLTSIDDELWWAFKTACTMEKKGLREKLIEMIEAEVRAKGLKPREG